MMGNTMSRMFRVLLVTALAVLYGSTVCMQAFALEQENTLSLVTTSGQPELYAAAKTTDSKSKSSTKSTTKSTTKSSTKTESKKKSSSKSTVKKTEKSSAKKSSTAKKTSTTKKSTAKKAPAPKRSGGGSIKQIIATKTAAKNRNSATNSATADNSVTDVAAAASSGTWIKIVKGEHKLYVMDGDNILKTYDVAVGRNTGQKEKVGDRRTPEGNFEVQQVQSATSWTHDFGDGKGVIQGAYGPWFIRLRTPWSGIGIHGTHDPSSIGKDITEGCIRLHNSDLQELKSQYIKTGMKVVIN